MSRRRGVDDAAGLTSIDLREEVPAALDGLEPVLLGRMVDIDGATWRRGLLDEVAAVTWKPRAQATPDPGQTDEGPDEIVFELAGAPPAMSHP